MLNDRTEKDLRICDYIKYKFRKKMQKHRSTPRSWRRHVIQPKHETNRHIKKNIIKMLSYDLCSTDIYSLPYNNVHKSTYYYKWQTLINS